MKITRALKIFSVVALAVLLFCLVLAAGNSINEKFLSDLASHIPFLKAFVVKDYQTSLFGMTTEDSGVLKSRAMISTFSRRIPERTAATSLFIPRSSRRRSILKRRGRTGKRASSAFPDPRIGQSSIRTTRTLSCLWIRFRWTTTGW